MGNYRIIQTRKIGGAETTVSHEQPAEALSGSVSLLQVFPIPMVNVKKRRVGKESKRTEQNNLVSTTPEFRIVFDDPDRISRERSRLPRYALVYSVKFERASLSSVSTSDANNSLTVLKRLFLQGLSVPIIPSKKKVQTEQDTNSRNAFCFRAPIDETDSITMSGLRVSTDKEESEKKTASSETK